MPLLELLGRGVPLYGLLGVLGACLGLVCALVRCPSLGLSRDDCAYLYVFGAIGAAAGAKLLYLLPRLPQLAAELPLLWEGPAAFAARWLSGGLVFYGGLFGGIAGAVVLGLVAARVMDGSCWVWAGLALVCFILPAVLSVLFCELLRKKGWIKEGDLKL